MADRAPVEHELKCWPEPFAAMKRGDKTFEYRKADRDFQVGDTLRLREWQPSWPPGEGSYTGDELRRPITFVLGAGLFGVPKGFCVLACPARTVGATTGGPAVDDPQRPYCKPDGSCCDFCCGN